MQNALKVSLGISKRAFTVAVVVATIAWSVAATFVIAPKVASAATASGDLVKGSLPAVYYVGSDGKRYVFTNDKAYKTWYADFSTVKTISDTELASITIGGNVTYKPGVRMVKIQSDPKVYAVAHGGVLRWVATEAAATALYGSDWNKKIDDISDAFFTNYTVGTQISSASDYVIANEQANSATINADKGLAGGGNLNITLASDSPAGMTVTKNAQGINLLKVNISGTGTITGLTFTRMGAGASGDWANVYLYDGDSRLTTGRSVSSSTNQAVFNNLNLAVSGSKTLTLVGDLVTGGATAGNAHYFSLAAATDVVAGTTVGGNFPVSGSQFVISGSSSGSITLAAGSTPSNPKLGETGVELANFKLTAGTSEDISLRRLVLTNSGSASFANLPNLKIMTGGTVVAQNPVISGSTATFIFAVPYVLGKGITRVFTVNGDIASGNRAGTDTIKLYVDQSYDVFATGNTYGSGVSVSGTFSGTQLTVQGGQLTFAFNGPSTGDIAVGSNDAVLAKFAVTSVNRVEVRNLRMRIYASSALSTTATTGEIANITDCKVKNADTGVTITNQYDLSAWTNAGDDQTFTKTFTDRFEIAAGQTLNMALTCDVLSTIPASMAGKSLKGTIDARVLGDIRNLDSNTDVAVTDIVPASALVGHEQTVRVSGLTVGLASSPSSATVTKGSTASALGVNFTAGSASDVKITQMKLRGLISIDADATTFGASESGVTDTATHTVQDVITSATIWDGSTQLGTAQSPDSNGDMNFTNLSWTVPAGTTKTVTVKVLLSNNLPYGTGTNNVVVDLIGAGLADNTTANVTAQDKDSNTVNATTTGWTASDFHLQGGAIVSAATTMTSDGTTKIITVVGSGTLQIQLDGDTPVAGIVTANTTDNSVTRLKFTSVNEAFNVTRLTVKNTTASTSRSITSVRLFDKNGTLFCAGALDSGDMLRCANDAGLFTVNGDHVITVKVNVEQEGSGTTGANSGDAPVMALYVGQDGSQGTYTDDIKVIGVSSGTALVDNDAGDQGDTTGVTFANASLKLFDDTTDSDQAAVTISGNASVIRKSQPTVATIATSTTLTSTPTVYKFSVTAASNGDVAIKRFNMSMDLENITSVGSYRVYENDTLLDAALYVVCAGASFSSGAITCGTDVEAGTVAADAVITVQFATERTVAAGTTKTFRVDAAVVGASAGDSLSHKLLDDSSANVETAALNATTLDDNNFVWSDTSADAHTAVVASSSADWTNGKYVKTLPTNPQTLSL